VTATAGSNRWLFGPASDLLLGCGLLYAFVFAFYGVAGAGILAVQPRWLFPLLVMLLSMPHYGATLLRVYEQREERRRYVLFAVWATLFVVALSVVAVHNVWIASLMFTVMVTWSPWHYTGQNYGLGLVFLRRRGVEVSPGMKRWVYAAFVLSYVFIFLIMHGSAVDGFTSFAYDASDVSFMRLGIPPSICAWLVPLTGAAYVVVTGVAGTLLVQRGGWRNVAPIAALALTQALWFVLPFGTHYFGWHTGMHPLDQQDGFRDYTLMIFMGHGLQYLWVTSYYARHSDGWSGLGNYYAKVLASGVAVWTLPVLLLTPDGPGGFAYDAGFSIVVGAAVNLHHFILDGAIWKLRNLRIARVLIRDEDAGTTAGTGAGWTRRLVWTAAGAGMILGFFEYYESRIAFPRALGERDAVAAARILDRIGWFGFDRSQWRAELGRIHESRDDLPAAALQYSRSVNLRPDAKVWTRLGAVEEKLGNYDSASGAYQAALAEDVRQAPLHAALGSIARRRGECDSAIQHFRDAHRLLPSSAARGLDLAWALATCVDPVARRPDEAVVLAETIVNGMQTPNARVLDALAASYAAAGRFDEAVDAEQRAIAIAAANDHHAFVADLDRKRGLFAARRPYVEEPSIPRSEAH
jgi:tetratricopeptide (TPR) repeat protein